MADFTWALLTNATRSVTGVGAVTDTFGAGTSDGMSLAGVGGFAVSVEADDTQTITTPVELSAWVQDPYSARWSRAPRWDVVGTTTGARAEYLDGFAVPSPAGRVAYAPAAGGVSSGNLTIRLIATGASAGELL